MNVRARLLGALTGVCAAMVVAQAAAQAVGAWPAKPIRMIVPYLAGGTPDILARALAQRVGEQIGQQVLVDNRPGAGGNIGTELAAKSPNDGYTIVVAAVSPFAINLALYAKKLAFDPVRDFEPVILIAKSPLILLVHPSLPVKSVAELVRLARARPGQTSYGSAGNGTSNHLVMEMFKSAAGADILHVPFKGTAQSLVAVIGGQIEMIMGQIPSTRPQVQSGRLRALAVSGARRSSVVPEVPTFEEAGVKGLDATSWYGIAVPAGTPREIVQRLNGEIARALASPEVRNRYLGEGAEPETGTPAEFAAFIRAEQPRWARAVRDSGARID